MLEFSASISQTWAEKASGPGFGKSILSLYTFYVGLRGPGLSIGPILILEGGMHIGGWNH